VKPAAALLRLLLAALLLALAACGGGGKENPLPSGAKVLALGDSLTAPHGVQPQEAWPVLLGQKTGWTVINGGVSGNTSAQGLERLPGLIDEHQPQLVLLSLGGNDMLRKQPQGQTVANLERMIDLARPGAPRSSCSPRPRPSLAGAVFNNLSAAEFYARPRQGQEGPADQGCPARGALRRPRSRAINSTPMRQGMPSLANLFMLS
jgi:acyl-CoA thioesterase-1